MKQSQTRPDQTRAEQRRVERKEKKGKTKRERQKRGQYTARIDVGDEIEGQPTSTQSEGGRRPGSERADESKRVVG
jgi:hypothetical protein